MRSAERALRLSGLLTESKLAIVYCHGERPLGPWPGIGTGYVPDRTD